MVRVHRQKSRENGPYSLWPVLIVMSLALLPSSRVAAQTVPPARPIQDPGQQLIDQQRAQAAQRALAQPPATITNAENSPSATALDIPLTTPIEQIPETGAAFLITKIDLDGNTVLSGARIHAITAPFIGHPLGSHRVSVLLKRLNDAFVSAGYITTRALLGPQNLESGTLKVTVQVGRISQYTINGQPIHRLKAGEASQGGGLLTDAGTEWAFPGAPGDALNLTDLDQGAAQINRLRRNQASLQIQPGQSPGDSVIAINDKPGDALYYDVGVDNYGSSATGVTRYRVGVEADNLIGLQESISLNYVGTQNSNALVGSVAVPFGRHTFSYTLSDSDYQELIGTSALESGRTLSHIFGWNYALERSQAGITSLDATLTWRRTDRTVNDIDLDPQRIAVLRVGGNWLRKFVLNDAPGNATLDAGISQGLPWFEADHDGDTIARSDAHSQFTKLDATATTTLPLPKLGAVEFVYRGTLSGQYTNVALYGSDQLYLGGMDTIRGFRSGEIVGDRGMYARNEIACVNTPVWHQARVEPYVFVDGGKANLVAVPGFPTLAAFGAGLRGQWQWRQEQISGEATLGRPLTQPASLGPKATLLLATMNVHF